MLFLWLLLVFVLEYTRPDQFFPFIIQLKLYSLVPAVLFLVTLFVQTRNPVGEVLGSNIGKLLIGLLFLVTVSALFAINKDRALELWQALLGYLFLFFMIARLSDSKERLEWVFRVLIGMHLWLIFQNPALLTDPTQRTYISNVTFLGDGNDFSLSVAIVLPMCLYLFQSSKSWIGKGFYVLSAMVLLGAIMGTQSRGAALAVIAVVFYLWTLSRNKGIGSILIVGGILVVMAVASEAYLSRMQTITSYQEDGSAMGRIEAWKGGVGMANSRPLTGMGPGCFSIAFGAFFAPPGWPPLTAHSVYFLTLGELGYPGLLLLLWLLWVMFRDNQRTVRSIPRTASPESMEYRQLMIAVNGSLIAFAVAGAFLSVLYYPHLYVIAGIIFAARRVSLLDCPREGEAAAEPAPATARERRRLKAKSRREARRKRHASS